MRAQPSRVETARRASSQLELVIAGREGWLNEDLRARLASSTLRGRIHFTGYVSDEDLRALYSSCLAFVYPSVYEGFGLPPLEAASCGAPVLASHTPAHLETLGADAALLFAPADADALARAILDLSDDESLRQKIADAGLRRAAEFTWERAARQTLEVYERAFGARAGLE
jgi:glycosyltransferase involved in cell wall biosynthesis